ncbi:DUF4474 domain-containing protein [Clostridium vincentii]|uniref:DUF4474 domain-containing protein n=1 Tax=Clostridium vincentii TaxID=52704 RepID=A0A2T0BAZ8_9CLOT|nr:DUF4474 domain-containing protein [Clostridium vincentii]PRR81058.1 hypothetical protein CLVI_28160 [Clostridium vincentii]
MFMSLGIGFSMIWSIVTENTMVTEVVQASQGVILPLWILIIILIIMGILYYKKNFSIPKVSSSGAKPLTETLPTNLEVKRTSSDEIYKTIDAAGYSYDSQQDIFYSNMDSWQKNMGYCSFYDEAAILSGMIIDCEPIKFIYEGKQWLIEFWKGQYGMSTGCEIGAYIRQESKINIYGIFKEAFYKGVGDEDKLQMSFSLRMRSEVLFSRSEKHWWLTGFKLGEFSEPSDLIMSLSITLKDLVMRDAFVEALKNVGYLNNEIIINGNTVALIFDEPRTEQPNARIERLDRITQTKNKILCDKYQEITKNYDTFPDKVEAIQNQAPDIYDKIVNIGKSKEVFRHFEKFKNNLNL